MSLRRLSLGWIVGVLTACTDRSARVAKTESTMTQTDSVAAWARAVDSAAGSTRAREFTFPARSTEGGVGRIYRLADSSVRVDIDDLGEMGKHRNRFYARGGALRLAVSSEERYDQPMSGNVVKTKVDSIWFVVDSATQWRDSLGVVHVQRDSTLIARGRAAVAEYRWSMRMADAGNRPRP